MPMLNRICCIDCRGMESLRHGICRGRSGLIDKEGAMMGWIPDKLISPNQCLSEPSRLEYSQTESSS